jgi:hypothetical protein
MKMWYNSSEENAMNKIEHQQQVQKKVKVRNYSFCDSKRLPESKMTEVNGIKIPSIPGSCYHAILCALAENKDHFSTWDKIIELTEKYIRKYGGPKAWGKFARKSHVKTFKQRVKDNTHTLTRSGKDCYGRRLHERGMCIYFFKDGAFLLTGGEFRSDGVGYEVVFPSGQFLQVRYRGTTMTYKEYRRFLSKGYIDISGKILDANSLKYERVRYGKNDKLDTKITSSEVYNSEMHVSITLSEDFDQKTAHRLETLGLTVEQCLGNELIGRLPSEQLKDLEVDKDVIDVIRLSD